MYRSCVSDVCHCGHLGPEEGYPFLCAFRRKGLTNGLELSCSLKRAVLCALSVIVGSCLQLGVH